MPVLLPEQFRNLPFISETLDHFRFTYIYFSSSQRLHVNELWIIDSISASGNYRSDLIRDLVAHIKACLNIPKQPSSFNELKKYYISRKDANRRFLVNEDKILDLLDSQSIKFTDLSDCDLVKQITMFSQCSLLISIHGNALTNMLWMPEGSTV